MDLEQQWTDRLFNKANADACECENCLECHKWHKEEREPSEKCDWCHDELCPICKGKGSYFNGENKTDCDLCETTGWKI